MKAMAPVWPGSMPTIRAKGLGAGVLDIKKVCGERGKWGNELIKNEIKRN